MDKMQAIFIKDGKGPIENLYVGETDVPSLKSQEVLVKITAFALNRMDISQRKGLYPLPSGASEILGVEFSGRIAALGPNTSAKWTIGDQVLGLASGGAYAEFIAVLETHILSKPPQLSWVEAASIPEAFITAFQALVLVGDIKPGEDVLVHAAASGVGIAAVQLARFYGARTITATASTKDKLEFILSLPAGATHVANYKNQKFCGRYEWCNGRERCRPNHRHRRSGSSQTQSGCTGNGWPYDAALPHQWLRSVAFGSSSDPDEASPRPGLYSALTIRCLQSRRYQPIRRAAKFFHRE